MSCDLKMKSMLLKIFYSPADQLSDDPTPPVWTYVTNKCWESNTNCVKQAVFAKNCVRIARYYPMLNDRIITTISA